MISDVSVFMTVPDRFVREDDVPARVEPTAPVSRIDVASLAIAVPPA
jgi:hypothetical protein